MLRGSGSKARSGIETDRNSRVVPKVTKSDETRDKDRNLWREKLTPIQYHICREGGTEVPYSGEYVHEKAPGIYLCVACEAELFDSSAKFESGTGWPSFYEPVAAEAISESVDRSHGMVRTEVVCSNCGSHLGHVFPDGPEPTGLRYCVNSVALKHRPAQ